ncbi:trehalase family glycosidase [Planctobacterium marinum]|uniref:trehalase family glycosidase n=1 Tax=Planctobacterium marinum TaxID=1631968 RepID=UPI0030C72C5D
MKSKLFIAVQSAALFSDSKTFADAIPNKPFSEIEEHWKKESHLPEFDLGKFVHSHFILPEQKEVKASDAVQRDMLQYISSMWTHLLRKPDAISGNSLIELPRPYIVPGGRFQEIYYWDTYFTALGLCEDGHYQLVLDMFSNFQYLIENNGCIPNGNRDYYRGRTQPPILALLLELLLNHKDKLPRLNESDFLESAVASLEQEYQYWMRGSAHLSHDNNKQIRCLLMSDGTVLNRYFDDHEGPRPESWREDSELASELPEPRRADFFKDVRAACESGWDFSSRWLAEPHNLSSIRTTDIVPVDLNCLLWKLETSLAHYHEVLSNPERAAQLKQAAQQRANAIQHWCWHQESGFYMDVIFSKETTSEIYSLAGVLPLVMGLASAQQAQQVSEKLASDFLKPGGLVTTLTETEQQWDSPNGWAPLQWFAVCGLENYGYQGLAMQVMERWLDNVKACLKTHGCMLEKYNVVTPGLIAGGGEYQVQTGFGWSNGVSRAFYKKLMLE